MRIFAGVKSGFRFAAAAALVATAWGSAQAASVDAGLTAGTLGVGPQVGFVLVPNTYDLRLNLGLLRYNKSTTSDGVLYDGKLKLQNLGLLADWHPFGGMFRLTGGLFYNDNRFDLDAKLQPGTTYTSNGVSYTAQPGDRGYAKVDFNKAAPYLGIG